MSFCPIIWSDFNQGFPSPHSLSRSHTPLTKLTEGCTKPHPSLTLLLTMSKSPRLYFSPIHFLWLPKGTLFRKVLIRSGERILSMEKLSHYHNVSPARHHLGKWLKPLRTVITHFGFWTLLLVSNHSCSLTFNHRCGDHGECWQGHGSSWTENFSFDLHLERNGEKYMVGGF